MVNMDEVIIRGFNSADGTTCYKIRLESFLNIFSNVLSKEFVEIGAKSYSENEFISLISKIDTHVALINNKVIGFCSTRQVSSTIGELLYLYIGDQSQCRGIGSALVLHAEKNICKFNQNLETIFLETAVPRYNQIFWERMGYSFKKSSTCVYPNGSIPSAQLEKNIKS